MTDLSLEDVEAATGQAEEGRTVQLKLESGEVVVARVRQIQTGHIECAVPDCFRRFDSERAEATHIGRMHPDWREKPTCPTCAEKFDPDPLDQKYCSRECYEQRGRTTIVCEGCGDKFSIRESRVDTRRHCSLECRADNDAYEGRESTLREDRECPECGDTFEAYPSEDQTYCSQSCYSASKTVSKSCDQCGRDFEVKTGRRDASFCSKACSYEHRRADPRPDDVHALLRELHVTDGFDQETTVDRALAHLRGEFSRDELLEELDVALVEDLDLPESSTADGLRDTISEASTYLELSQTLRCPRDAAKKLVRRLDLEDELVSPSQGSSPTGDLLERARENLGIDEDDEESVSPWREHARTDGGEQR